MNEHEHQVLSAALGRSNDPDLIVSADDALIGNGSCVGHSSHFPAKMASMGREQNNAE